MNSFQCIGFNAPTLLDKIRHGVVENPVIAIVLHIPLFHAETSGLAGGLSMPGGNLYLSQSRGITICIRYAYKGKSIGQSISPAFGKYNNFKYVKETIELGGDKF